MRRPSGNLVVNESQLVVLDLDTLGSGIPVISPDAAGHYKEATMNCLEDQGHQSGVFLQAPPGQGDGFNIQWSGMMTPQLRRNHRDLKKATDFAACALALLIVRETMEDEAVEQAAALGSGVDYYLARKGQVQENDLIFNRTRKLEVSGILKARGSNTLQRRVQEKARRFVDDGLPTLIIVVEFSPPQVEVLEL